LLILAAGSIFIGWIGISESIGGGDKLGKYLDPLFHLSTIQPTALSTKLEPLLMLLSLLVAWLGMGLAWYVYGLKHTVSKQLLQLIPGGKKLLEQKYYVDEIYEVTVVRWVKGFASWVSDRLVEQILINRIIDFITGGVYALARLSKRVQTGMVRFYLAYVVLGAALLVYLILH